jgi:hypothetical protein
MRMDHSAIELPTPSYPWARHCHLAVLGLLKGALAVGQFRSYLQIAHIKTAQLTRVVEAFLRLERRNVSGAVGVMLDRLLRHVFITTLTKR